MSGHGGARQGTGQKPKLDYKQRRKVYELAEMGITHENIAKRFGIGRYYVSNVVAEQRKALRA